MSDPRPSEADVQDVKLTFPMMRHLGFFKDNAEPTADESDPVEALIEQAVNANSPEQALVYAQIATVRAIQALTATLLQEVTR